MLLFYFSSQTNGDCLFSSVSILLVGNSGLAEDLRTLCCLELFLHAEFYSNHPCLRYAFSFHRNLFSSFNSVLFMSLSNKTFESDLKGADLIKNESLVMHKKGQWSTFICILALASVIDQKIVCYYPDFGDAKIKALFNQLIVPRSFYVNPSSSGFFKINHILFCQLGTQGHDFSKANHFVPLILNKNSQRSKKRVLSSEENIK